MTLYGSQILGLKKKPVLMVGGGDVDVFDEEKAANAYALEDYLKYNASASSSGQADRSVADVYASNAGDERASASASGSSGNYSVPSYGSQSAAYADVQPSNAGSSRADVYTERPVPSQSLDDYFAQQQDDARQAEEEQQARNDARDKRDAERAAKESKIKPPSFSDSAGLDTRANLGTVGNPPYDSDFTLGRQRGQTAASGLTSGSSVGTLFGRQAQAILPLRDDTTDQEAEDYAIRQSGLRVGNPSREELARRNLLNQEGAINAPPDVYLPGLSREAGAWGGPETIYGTQAFNIGSYDPFGVLEKAGNAAGVVGRAAGDIVDPFGITKPVTSFINPFGGGVSAGDIGEFAAKSLVPRNLQEVALEFAPGLGDVRGAYSALQRGAREGIEGAGEGLARGIAGSVDELGEAGLRAGGPGMAGVDEGLDLIPPLNRPGGEIRGAARDVPLTSAANPPPGGAPPTPPPGGIPDDPVKKLTDLINAAKPARRETEALKSAELSRRAGAVAGVLENSNLPPSQRFRAATGQLKGELPMAEFTPPKTEFSSGEVDDLFSRILQADLRPFEKINTSEALTKTLAGQIPQRAELANLERVFGPELVDALLSKRSLGTKAWENVVDMLNLPRTIATTFDASAPLRQGAILSVAHPKEAFGSMGAMIKAMASPKAAQAVDDAIRHSPYRDVMEQAGLYIAPTGRAAGLTQREEAFMSRLVRSVPGVREVVGASERGYVTYLNKLRSDTFSTIVGNWERTGDLTPQRAQKLANFLNVATGRGRLGPLERAADVLSIPFFAPRLVASRFQTPLALIESDPLVRKAVARDLTAFVGTGLTALGLAKLAGAEVELDPRSTDFGRIKVGDTRLDFWGGFQPVARNAAQIITGQRKGEGGALFETDRKDAFLRFLRSKLSPGGSLAADLWSGETFLGEDLESSPGFVGNEAAKRFAPLFLQDMYDAASLAGVKGALLASPSFLGASTLTYTKPSMRFMEAFNTATGQEWNKMLDSERFTLLEQHPELMDSFNKWQDTRESVTAQITSKKYKALEDLAPLAQSDPEAYRAQAGDIVAKAAIEYDFASQAGLIPKAEYPQTPEQKAVQGFFDAAKSAYSDTGVDYDLRENLQAEYLATLSPELRDKVINEVSFSKDPTYRELLQDRQTLQPYFEAPDTAFGLAKKLASQTPEGSPQRLVLQFDSLTALRSAIEETLRKAGVPTSDIDNGRMNVEEKLGLTNLIDAARKATVAQDPSLVLKLEKWGYYISEDLRKFAAEQVAGR